VCVFYLYPPRQEPCGSVDYPNASGRLDLLQKVLEALGEISPHANNLAALGFDSSRIFWFWAGCPFKDLLSFVEPEFLAVRGLGASGPEPEDLQRPPPAWQVPGARGPPDSRASPLRREWGHSPGPPLLE